MENQVEALPPEEQKERPPVRIAETRPASELLFLGAGSLYSIFFCRYLSAVSSVFHACWQAADLESHNGIVPSREQDARQGGSRSGEYHASHLPCWQCISGADSDACQLGLFFDNSPGLPVSGRLCLWTAESSTVSGRGACVVASLFYRYGKMEQHRSL